MLSINVEAWSVGKLQCNIFSWVQHYPKSDVLRIAVLKKFPLTVILWFVIQYTPLFNLGGVIFKALHLILYFHIKLFISTPLHKQCFCSIISGLGKCSQTAFIVISNHMLQINWKSWTNLLYKIKSQSCMCQCMYMCVYIHTWVCLWVICWMNFRILIDLLSLVPQLRAEQT